MQPIARALSHFRSTSSNNWLQYQWLLTSYIQLVSNIAKGLCLQTSELIEKILLSVPAYPLLYVTLPPFWDPNCVTSWTYNSTEGRIWIHSQISIPTSFFAHTGNGVDLGIHSQISISSKRVPSTMGWWIIPEISIDGDCKISTSYFWLVLHEIY